MRAIRRPAIRGFHVAASILIALGCEASEKPCDENYLAYPRDELEEKIIDMSDVSMFSLLVDHDRFMGRTIATAGMLVYDHEHRRAFLVPVASALYWFTDDSIRMEVGPLPECMLRKLNGVPIWVWGILDKEDNGDVIVRPIYFLGGIPVGPLGTVTNDPSSNGAQAPSAPATPGLPPSPTDAAGKDRNPAPERGQGRRPPTTL